MAERKASVNKTGKDSYILVICHDEIIKWNNFLHYWPFVRGINWSPVNSPHKGQWRRALIFSLICAWINGWVNKREAGDLRCPWAHYYVTVIYKILTLWSHWGRDKMAAISQTIFSSAFPWISNKISLKYIPQGLIYNNGLAPNKCQAIIWSNVNMLYWCMYVSLGLGELSSWHCGLDKMATNVQTSSSNTIVADALTPGITKSLSTLVLTIQEKQLTVI